MSMVQMEPTLMTVSPSRKSPLPLTAFQCLTARLNKTVITPVNSVTYSSNFFFLFYPLDIFTQFKRKKKDVLVQFLFNSTVWIWMWRDKPELSIKRWSSSVFCFMEGRCHPRNPQLCCTGKLATFKKHNHLRTCNKCREMGKWPYCQLAKDKWRAQICEFTGFLRIEGWFIINTCFCFSLQSFDGASINMNMDTDFYRQKFITTRCVKQNWLLKRHPLVDL